MAVPRARPSISAATRENHCVHIVFDMVENVATRTETLGPMPRTPAVDPDLEMDLESLTNLPNLPCI